MDTNKRIADYLLSVDLENEYLTLNSMCTNFTDWYQSLSGEEEVYKYDEILEGYTIIESFLIAHSITFEEIEFNNNRVDNSAFIFNFCHELAERSQKLYEESVFNETISNGRDKYRQVFKIDFGYEFEEKEINKIQLLINELRDLIVNNKDIENDHKERLLKRLENLQKELHKRVSSLDKFWGLIGDAGVALGKFGKDAKPLVDRIREISEIIWRAQARAEGLPSSSKLPSLNEMNK